MWLTDHDVDVPAVPGDVLALLTTMQELPPGLYMVESMSDEWVTVRWLIDDEELGRLVLTDQQSMLPVRLLELFMPVGIRLRALA